MLQGLFSGSASKCAMLISVLSLSKPNMSGGRKFDSKKYKDLRDFKNKEIKRSLVHRARLRKNYFKLLEKDQKENPQKEDIQKEDTQEPETHNEPKHSDDQEYSTPNQQKKPISYAERAKLVKERKEQKRKDALRVVQERRQNIEKSKLARERNKEKLNQKTKYGQPLMGPRINNLLDKIKKDQGN